MDDVRPLADTGFAETTASSRVAVAPVTTARFGPYVVVAKLGQGGMCEVHLALHEGPSGFRKLVALKRLFPHLNEEPAAVRMFLDEARLAARLSHPHLVQTHEVGEIDGLHFLAMEYLAGQPFQRVLQRAAQAGAPMPLPLVARVIADALDGLHHAHELADYDGSPLGVVHRDVSPHNLFVTYDGVTKLLDFGVAKAGTQESVTRVGMVKGKFAYMAPEQARGERVDPRADLWSVGVVLWEAVSGHRLFKADTEAATLERSLTMQVPPLRDVRPDVPPPVAELVARALRRDPEARPGSALEMREALEGWLARAGHGGGRSALREHVRAEFGALEREQRALVKRCVENASAPPPPATAAATAPASQSTATATPPSGLRRPGRVRRRAALVALGAVALAAGVAMIARERPTGDGAGPTVASLEAEPAAPRSVDDGPVAAQELLPGDVPPRLVAGSLPASPSLGALTPTITTRVLVDEQGHVTSARIFGPRAEVAAHERAALRAVRDYRFDPATRAGVPIAVWTNVPIRFEPIDDRPARLRIKGSDTIGGALGPDLAQAFMTAHPEVAVTVEALGSSTAFSGLFDGSADLGASSRPVGPRELAEAEALGLPLREFVVAYDGIAVIVHRSNPVTDLTLAELAAVFGGEIRDWSELGGNDARVRVLSRPSYSGTHAFFRDTVLPRQPDGAPAPFAAGTEFLERNEELLDVVARDPAAIGYVGFGWLLGDLPVHTVAVAPHKGEPAIAPSLATIRADEYPLARPLLFYTVGAPRGLVAELLRFAFSDEGRRIIAEHGFAPAGTTMDPLEDPAHDAVREREVRRVWFGRGGTRIDDDSVQTLEEVAALLSAGDRRALVVGHADADGDRTVNRELALARAEQVVARLVAMGADERRLEATSAAAEQPIASNETASGRQANRRVDVLLVSE